MDGDSMRLFANRTTRRLLLAVTAVLLLYALAIQFLSLHFSLSLLLLSLAASGVILILCIRYFKKQDSIMEDANDQITRILSGQRDERIDCDEEGELFCLFHSVNTLSAVLDAQMEREKQTNEFLKSMVSDISHQLKTPLSALGIYNELIADADNMGDIKRFSDASETELARIDTLIKNLLTLARLDAGAIVFEKHRENIAEIMDDLKQRFSYRAELEKKEIRLTGEDEFFFCDAEWLTESFGNLIKNALDHTSEGGIISVDWKKNGNILKVTFCDNGSGIHPEDIAHIFKRFYRSRFSKDTKGCGLGLPLAKTIIEAHDGMIEVDSELGRGTIFSVFFRIPTEL